MHQTSITLIECPRDAMQGWKNFIPAEKKIAYLNALLRVGFDTLDCGSFVSPKAIPQMADTAEVIASLDMQHTHTKLLTIVANKRGAEEACRFDSITCLGFPFSVSETFQLRNTNSTIADSLERVKEIQELCVKNGKQLVIYISMGFGNPYGDPWSEEVVFEWVNKIAALGINIISLADTVGLATPQQVEQITGYCIKALPSVNFGVHLHSTPHIRKAKIDAALKVGCRRFDGALKGIGGCPMANDELVGNMDTEWMISHFDAAGYAIGLDREALATCSRMAGELFV